MGLALIPGRGAWLRLIVAVLAGVVIGALQQWSVTHLSYPLYPLCNTAAPLVLVAFVVALCGRSRTEVGILGIVVLVSAVLGFYAAQEARHWTVARDQVAFWTLSALIVGPLVGLAAGWVRHGDEFALSLGAGIVGGMLVGEALHGLRFLGESTVVGYWYVELAVGLGLAVGLTLLRSLARRAGLPGMVGGLAVTLGSCALFGLGTYVVYMVP